MQAPGHDAMSKHMAPVAQLLYPSHGIGGSFATSDFICRKCRAVAVGENMIRINVNEFWTSLARECRRWVCPQAPQSLGQNAKVPSTRQKLLPFLIEICALGEAARGLFLPLTPIPSRSQSYDDSLFSSLAILHLLLQSCSRLVPGRMFILDSPANPAMVWPCPGYMWRPT